MADYRFHIKELVWGVAALLMALACPGQEQPVLDSLTRVAAGPAPDSARINALIELSRIYTGIDDDKAALLAQSALKKSEEIKQPKWVGFSLNRIGTIYDTKSQPDSALPYFLKALRIFESANNYSGLAAVYQNIGVMYHYQKDFDKALENYHKALPLRQKTGEMNYVAQLYNNMGSVMRRKKEYDSALTYYQKALEIKQKLNDKQSLATSYMNVSVAYQYKKDFFSAIENVNKAIELCRTTGNNYDLASCYLTLGEIYLKLRKVKEARQQALLGLDIAKELKSSELLFNGYEELSLCDTLAGNFREAFADYVNAVYYKDEVYSQEKAKAIGKLHTFYESEKKDSQIKLLNADNETKSRQQRLLLVVLLLSVVLLALALWAYVNKQKHNKILARQKAEIENKTELLKNQAAQIARLSSQMNPHFLFNALNSLQKLVLQKDETLALDHISQLSALMRATLTNSAREYISLQEEESYLELYLEFEKNLLGAEFQYHLCFHDLDKQIVRIPPMLVQPLVENAVKHGLAAKEGEKKLFVSFSAEGSLLKISVRDHGVGRADAGGEKPHAPMALSITTSRIKAEFEKSSLPVEPPLVLDHREPKGTEVILYLPLTEDF